MNTYSRFCISNEWSHMSSCIQYTFLFSYFRRFSQFKKISYEIKRFDPCSLWIINIIFKTIRFTWFHEKMEDVPNTYMIYQVFKEFNVRHNARHDKYIDTLKKYSFIWQLIRTWFLMLFFCIWTDEKLSTI